MSATTTVWSYDAVDGAGRRARGRLEAAGPDELARTLEARGLTVVDAEPLDGGARHRSLEWRFGARREVLEATRALAALLGAGLPLSRALATAAHVSPGRTARALEEVGLELGRGASLAAALDRHPGLFPRAYIGVVRAGERGGRLAQAFAALAAQLEREDQLRARLLGAMLYPALLAVAGGVAVGVLLFVVLPRFAELLESTGAALPRSTTWLLAVAGGLERGWPWLLAAGVVVAASAMLASRTGRGRRARATLLLSLPVVGDARRHVLAGRFARVLGVLTAGGAPMLSALDEALASIDDPLSAGEVARIHGRVRDGAALSTAIAEGDLHPPLLARLVAVGEEAGRLEEFLAHAARLCEERADRSLHRLVSLVEPGMILVLGGLILLVALALLQAIYGVDAGAFR